MRWCRCVDYTQSNGKKKVSCMFYHDYDYDYSMIRSLCYSSEGGITVVPTLFSFCAAMSFCTQCIYFNFNENSSIFCLSLLLLLLLVVAVVVFFGFAFFFFSSSFVWAAFCFKMLKVSFRYLIMTHFCSFS